MTMKPHGLLVALLTLSTISGCGVVYTPQEFEKSITTYGYRGDFGAPIDVIPLTFFSARIANADDYVPRSLPDTFRPADGARTVSTRDRLAQSGLDRVTPALQFDLPETRPSYDAAGQIIAPGLRSEDNQPLPPLDLNLRGLDDRPPAQADDFSDLRGMIQPLRTGRQPNEARLPAIEPEPYVIGPGDVIGILSRLQSLSITQPSATDLFSDATKELLVQGNGEIYIPQAGSVDVGGLTLTEARSAIFDRLVENQLDFDFGVEILRFGSQTIAVSGPAGASVIPVTVKPPTLGDAVFTAGGIGADPENVIVRVLREGTIYEMSGDRFAGSTTMARRYLKDGDVVTVTQIDDSESALTYFDQQFRLRQLENSQRNVGRESLQFEIELENYRLQAERLRQESAIGRLAARREADRQNEEARIANIAARQEYLNRLRELEIANREGRRSDSRERRETLLANIEERARERRERRELLELELQEERLRLSNERERRVQERAVFNDRIRLGAIQRDYVTVAGELNRQTIMPLPFDSIMTLNRVLYEDTNGINLLTADSSEIYVFRALDEGAVDTPLRAYHLNASNPAGLAVASKFEMRPNDVVYVNPQPITNWNRVISLILPSTGLLQNGVSAFSGFGD